MKSEAVYTIIYNIAKIKNQKVICNACKRWYGMPATLLKNRLWHWCFPVSCDYLPTNCLSVFDHFVGLAIKGLSMGLFKWVNKTLCYLVFIYVHISFFVFVMNDFKSAPLALLAKKVSVRGWMILLVFFVTFQCHFEKCCRTNFCSSMSLKDWPDLILGFPLNIAKISSANYFA